MFKSSTILLISTLQNNLKPNLYLLETNALQLTLELHLKKGIYEQYMQAKTTRMTFIMIVDIWCS